MGTVHYRPLRCERARRWASLGLDGELSELEGAMLARHLESCADCAAFAAEQRALTEALRAAPVERPARVFALPARRVRVDGGLLRVAAIAAVVAGALGIAGGTERPTGDRPSGAVRVAAHSGLDTDQQIRDLRRRELRASVDGTTLRRDLLLPL